MVSDDVQKQSGADKDALIEMHDQEQNTEEFLDPVQSEDRMTIGNMTESFSLIEKGLYTNFRKSELQ
ncbi:hypothetical protein TNCV_3833841 [Trichonephila clavipes]|nr:hypothetical protein TNCV_3833841 [Trichonephila clavipes]